MSLGPEPGVPGSRRPFQRGKARGKKDGRDVEVDKNWLIDPGADISKIRSDNARNFDLEATGGGAEGTTGAAMSVFRGLTMRFKRINRRGEEENTDCSLNVAVAAGGSNIIGMDQLAEANCRMEWDPVSRTGRIVERERPKTEEILKVETIQDRLTSDVRDRLMTDPQRAEILEQKKIFDSHRSEIEGKFQGRIVGAAGGQLFVGNTVHDVIEQVRSKLPGKLVYFESVGFGLLGSEGEVTGSVAID